jgi:hypothetical protein
MERAMRSFDFGLVVAAAMLPSAMHAQDKVDKGKVDMARITCAEYLAMSPQDDAIFSAWMSGWFNQKKGYVTLDLDVYKRNISNVKAWCANNPTQSVMASIERVTTSQ